MCRVAGNSVTFPREWCCKATQFVFNHVANLSVCSCLYFRTQTGGSEGGGEIRRRLGSFGRKKGPAAAAASEEKYSSNESITSAYGTYLLAYFVYFSNAVAFLLVNAVRWTNKSINSCYLYSGFTTHNHCIIL